MDWRVSVLGSLFAIVPQDHAALPTKDVPVLLFHAVCAEACPPEDPYGVSAAQLASILGTMKAAGYESITPLAYVHRSFTAAKPVLITFDDSRRDSYVNADPVLEATGMRATMYVITANAERPAGKSMTWAQIEDADRFGRWDIQLHADEGHVRIPVSEKESLPFYANRRWSDAGVESFTTWTARVEADIARGNALLAAHVPSYQPVTFAVPFGDYGQKGSNDAAIQPALRRIFDAAFPVWFTQPAPRPPFAMAAPSHEQPRFTVFRETTAASIMSWLTLEK